MMLFIGMRINRPFSVFLIALSLFASGICLAQTIPFAKNGTLKMLYDNRMYPQALEYQWHLYIVWRGAEGLPHIVSYDLNSALLSEPVMILEGLDLQIDAEKYERDHHYAPVVWIDGQGHLHTLFGCHGNSGGVHLISKQPGRIDQWTAGPEIYKSISYPQVHQIYEKGSLVYFRDRGHLGSWTYRISRDDGKSWNGASDPVVDLDREPHTGFLASHAGSYHSTRVSRDGRRLHVAFIWKVEEPVPNTRYQDFLGDHTQRYNLYYLYVDLPSGEIFNHQGKKLIRPVDKLVADRDCLVWDTEERVAAVPSSIYLDEEDTPFFLLPVSEETPFRCRYYFVKSQDGAWQKTAITRTPHPFNASYLTRTEERTFHAYLVSGGAESAPGPNMDRYGWGDRVELWKSDNLGTTWRLSDDLTPVPGLKYQNIQFILGSKGKPSRSGILFYAWEDEDGPGTGFLYLNTLDKR